MEPISGEPTVPSIQNNLNGNSVKSSTTLPPNETVPHGSKVNLNAVADLSNSAHNSSTDIREDVVEKAKQLLNDPDWLSDDNLFNLSSKLLQNENFDS
jgi:hypothetical protein